MLMLLWSSNSARLSQEALAFEMLQAGAYSSLAFKGLDITNMFQIWAAIVPDVRRSIR